MRYTKLMLVLLGFAATLCAADPFVGTWKMNPAKTKYKAGTAPKEQTVTITEAGTDLNVSVAGTAADGKLQGCIWNVNRFNHRENPASSRRHFPRRSVSLCRISRQRGVD